VIRLINKVNIAPFELDPKGVCEPCNLNSYEATLFKPTPVHHCESKISQMLYFLLFVYSCTFNANPTTWQTNFEEAKRIAVEQDKKILMVFSGSDWCAPCIKLKKKILVTEEFQEFEKENVVVLYLDFPQRKKNRLSKEMMKHNESMADNYNRSGIFPNILLVDVEGTVIKNVKYEGQSPG